MSRTARQQTGPRAQASRPSHRQQDQRDRLILETLLTTIDGFERGGLLGGFTAAEVVQWLKARATFYIAARDLGLVD